MLLSVPTKTRRQLLKDAACGFGSLALAGMLGNQGRAVAEPTANPLAPKPPHFAPRAQRVIFLFMQGGPSHVDTFDPKERLRKDNGAEFSFRNDRTRRDEKFKLMKSLWGFKQYGECGTWVSDLFPDVAGHVDDLCVIKSMVTKSATKADSSMV